MGLFVNIIQAGMNVAAVTWQVLVANNIFIILGAVYLNTLYIWVYRYNRCVVVVWNGVDWGFCVEWGAVEGSCWVGCVVWGEVLCLWWGSAQ